MPRNRPCRNCKLITNRCGGGAAARRYGNSLGIVCRGQCRAGQAACFADVRRYISRSNRRGVITARIGGYIQRIAKLIGNHNGRATDVRLAAVLCAIPIQILEHVARDSALLLVTHIANSGGCIVRRRHICRFVRCRQHSARGQRSLDHIDDRGAFEINRRAVTAIGRRGNCRHPAIGVGDFDIDTGQSRFARVLDAIAIEVIENQPGDNRRIYSRDRVRTNRRTKVGIVVIAAAGEIVDNILNGRRTR